MNMTRKPLMQDLIKEAAALGAQQAAAALPKTAADDGDKAKKDDKGKKPEKDANGAYCDPAKMASEALSTDTVEKLAAAIESVLPDLHEKLAEGQPLPPGVTKTDVTGTMPGPNQQGKATHQPPATGLQKANPQEKVPNQMKNDMDSPPGAGQKQQVALSGNGGKTASTAGQIRRIPMRVGEEIGKVTGHHYDHDKAVGAAALGAGALGLGAAAHAATKKKEASDLTQEETSFVDWLVEKQAEDAINPAHISAGPAKGPDTSASGEAAPGPAGGPPKGPTNLIATNESMINFTRGQAYANRKADLAPLFKERALSAATDTTLNQAFAHTREAGPKIAGDAAAPPAESEEATKAAAARIVIERLRSEQPGAAAKE